RLAGGAGVALIFVGGPLLVSARRALAVPLGGIALAEKKGLPGKISSGGGTYGGVGLFGWGGQGARPAGGSDAPMSFRNFRRPGSSASHSDASLGNSRKRKS